MSSKTAGILALFIALTLCYRTHAQGNSIKSVPISLGFTLADSLQEYSLTYFTIDNLIVLPFVINGNLSVNLILDTGCQSLILFGKQYEKMFDIIPNFSVTFSGIGAGKPAVGSVALDNIVTLGPVRREKVPIVIVPGKKLFRHHQRVDGLIGYDLFTRFEIEIHPVRQQITFRSATNRNLPPDYYHIPLKLDHHRPTISATFALPEQEETLDMLVDTGSSLSILLTTSDKKGLPSKVSRKILGMGLNGFIMGSNSVAKFLHLNDYTATNVQVALTYSPMHNYASVGMAFLKNYSIIINYLRGYIGLRPPEEEVVVEEIL
jgi:predicted aspartyl protease